MQFKLEINNKRIHKIPKCSEIKYISNVPMSQREKKIRTEMRM